MSFLQAWLQAPPTYQSDLWFSAANPYVKLPLGSQVSALSLFKLLSLKLALLLQNMFIGSLSLLAAWLLWAPEHSSSSYQTWAGPGRARKKTYETQRGHRGLHFPSQVVCQKAWTPFLCECFCGSWENGPFSTPLLRLTSEYKGAEERPLLSWTPNSFRVPIILIIIMIVW